MKTSILLFALLVLLPTHSMAASTKEKKQNQVKSKKLSKEEENLCVNKPLKHGKTDYQEMKAQWKREDFFYSDAPLFFISDGLTAIVCGAGDYLSDAASVGPKDIEKGWKWTVYKSSQLANSGGRMIASGGHTVSKAFKKNPLKNTPHYPDDPNSPFNPFRVQSAE